MAKKKDDKDSELGSRADPKHDERRRLRSLAFSRKLLSQTPSKSPSSPLRPSAAVVRHQGRDLVKKGQRRNRFLFSFPGFIAPAGAGGKIGDLADLATGNPILYLEFPQGRMKLFGTIVYPKNRYLTLQFARKNVLCEDTFDSMIVFSDAWWIGTKEENPEEAKLDFPKEFSEVKDVDCDFKGGVSASSQDKPVGRSTKEVPEPLSPEIEIKDEDDTSEDFLPTEDAFTNSNQATPVRQSSRLVGKSLNFAEKSSSDESGDSDSENSNSAEDVKFESNEHQVPLGEDIDVKGEMMQTFDIPPLPAKNPESSSKEKGRLVQCTLSTLFMKAIVKKVDSPSEISPEPKGHTGSGTKRQRKSLIDKTTDVNGGNKHDSTLDVSPEPKGPVTNRQRKSSIDRTTAINRSNKHDSPLDLSPEPKDFGTKRPRRSSTDRTSAVKGSNKHGSTGVKAGVKRKLKLHQEEDDDDGDDIESSSESQEADSDEEWVG